MIDHYALQPHPEGGWFAETYRADTTVDTPNGPRAASTAILFLLASGNVSHLHRIASDEIWHFYEGGPLLIHELRDGDVHITRLSPDHPQHVVPAGTWFGARPAPGADYALVGCTVAPGFDFADFELAEKGPLLADAGWSRAAQDVIKTMCAS
nr:cupin domain-containing protein [Aquisalinus flavus]